MFDPFGLNNHINTVLSSMMMDPFMTPQQRRQQQQQQQQQQGSNGNSANGGQLRPFDPFGTSSALSPFDFHHRAMTASNPFSLMHQMMSNMDNVFRPVAHDPFSAVVHADPNSEVYSSSSMITYSSGGGDGGRPKVFQQSKQMRAGPGGVKETREMVRDSERGIEQMAIGHHIGEKAHVIERKRTRNGEIEETVNLENLDDEEVTDFNREFEKRIGAQYRASQHQHGHQHRAHHHLNTNHPLPIEHSSNK